MVNFNIWKQKYQQQDLVDFSFNKEAILWLKIKSIIRKDTLSEFLKDSRIVLESKTLNLQFEELYKKMSCNIENSNILLDKFIREESKKIFAKLNFNKFVSELYKIQHFQWGGDYNNSLDKFLISRYVKAISSYDLLLSKFTPEINDTVRNYVLSSWYNHWSSILIEHIFKIHPKVLPTVGKIKSVDFFIHDIPFDLKVTYLPHEYQKIKHKEKNLPIEITFLKRQAKLANIHFDSKAIESSAFYEITEKMKDKADDLCISTLETIQSRHNLILQDVLNHPNDLARWLYENQGEMRFGSENRLYLVLIDKKNWNNSWQLKRNINLLQPAINSYLKDFSNKKIENMKLNFVYKGKKYTTFTDILFVVK